MKPEHTARYTSSHDIRTRVEGVICDRCQDQCWTAEIWCHDLAGTGAKVCTSHRPHIDSQARALAWVGVQLATVAREVKELERARWILEHQGTLF